MAGENCYEQLRKIIKGRVLASEPMSRHTSWRIGGAAELLVEPEDSADLCRALGLARSNGLPVTVIGNGTNLLVSDSGVRGMVIKLIPGLSRLGVKDSFIYAGAGVPLPKLANYALQAGLAGFEFLAGIPGTVGGALIMNAGANGYSIGERVRLVETVDYAGNKVIFKRGELEFSYRKSCLSSRGLVITGAEFDGFPCPGEEIKKRMDDYRTRRRNTQPLELPNAGSVFKNPPGDSAGRLIEIAGCKGLKVGAMQVSLRHANFFVNLGGGTAADVLELVHRVRGAVEQQCSVKLSLEVQMLGEF